MPSMLVQAVLILSNICHFLVLPMDAGEGTSRAAEMAGNERHGQISGQRGGIGTSGASGLRGSARVRIDPRNATLSAILALFDWLAINGDKLLGKENVLVDLEMALQAPDLLGQLGEIFSEFCREVRPFLNTANEPQQPPQKRLKVEKRAECFLKFPNSRALLFRWMLFDALNIKIDPQELERNLQDNSKAGESEDERRLRQKIEFKFAFMVNCIYASHMDSQGQVDYEAIVLALKGPREVGQAHPIERILVGNQCGEAEMASAFVHILDEANTQNLDTSTSGHEMDKFFKGLMKKHFVGQARAQLAEGPSRKWQLLLESTRLKRKPYFPEELPKMASLSALLYVGICLVKEMVDLLKPEGYRQMWGKIDGILEEIMHKIMYPKHLLHFVISHGSHYQEELGRILNEHLKLQMRRLSPEGSMFPIVWADVADYDFWLEHLQTLMVKFLAVEQIGMALLPNELQRGEDVLPTVRRMAGQIVHERINAVTDQSRHPAVKRGFLQLIHLRIFCVGIRQKRASQTHFVEPDSNVPFTELLDLSLLEIMPVALARVSVILEQSEADSYLNEEEGVELLDRNGHFRRALDRIVEEECICLYLR